MRALVLGVLLLLLVGFDHPAHERVIDAKGQAAVTCTKCHTLGAGALVGKPGHAACFGACHGPPPKPTDAPRPDQAPLCTACHAASKLAAKQFAVAYPPYIEAPDFVLQLGHAKHAKAACTTCHTGLDAPRTTPPHQRCIGCHTGAPSKPFALTDCRGCHHRAAEDPTPLRMRDAATAFPVTTAFAHARHAGRGAAKQCATCHPGIAETDARALPRPAATSCAIAGCHDAKAAFGLFTGCTKCHRDAPASVFLIKRHPERFSHTFAKHADAKLPCAACHPINKAGLVEVAGHDACVGCHRADFLVRESVMCASCHNGNEPWRALVPDRLPAPNTEFGATLDHKTHASIDCASCHSLTTATTQLRPPRRHEACARSGCHTPKTGPAPHLEDCERCHELGLADRRDATRRAATWSVRTLFTHATHGAPCKSCHVDLSAKAVLELAAPPKSTCAPCHDGTKAFKLTGTTCTRCHPGPTK